MALLTAAVTSLALTGVPGPDYGDFTKTPTTGTRTYSSAFTRLGLGGTPSKTYGAFTHAVETDVIVEVSDSLVAVITEGPVSDVDIDVTETMPVYVTESRAVGQNKIGNDTLIPVIRDQWQFVDKAGTTAKTGSDSLVPVLSESASLAILIGVTDSLVPVVTEASSLATGTGATGSDSVGVVLTETATTQKANALREFAVTDTLTLVLTDSAQVEIAGDVDRIVYRITPKGYIKVRFV